VRVAIDARELSGRPTGVGRYLGGLLREWAGTASDSHEFVLYAHQAVDPALAAGCAVRVAPGSGGTIWEQRALPRALAADRPDVLFSPAYSTPLFTATPRVVALHDISFVARPDWYRWREGMRRRLLAKRSAAAARAVVTISDFSKSEIVRRLGLQAARIHVIPPGIDAPRGSTHSGDGSAQVLYVGSIFNRRHVPELVAAFDSVAQRHPDVSLHMVGDNRSHPHQDIAALIAARPTAHRMHWHRYVDDDRLHQLYRDARAFAFLSEYEGLGLTPLEALAAGVPSLLLDTAVARESCGDAALYVSLGDARAIGAALERLVYDESTRRGLLMRAPAVLARYDWARAARETLAVLEAAR
jgi:glycosyltransferase involved in cell wall biosynthesis